ncbi:MAG: patatin-like phospholipase family protein [Blastocatellia bacterium]|nr:patatin-like phospholipase family protein [Blastocatellia bacterium]
MEFDIVFEGGGAKGNAFVGALEVLNERGHKHRRLIGTSAGSITATLLAAGYTPEEMRQVVTEKVEVVDANGSKTVVPRFSLFLDTPVNFTQDTVKDSFLDPFLNIDIPYVPKTIERYLTNEVVEHLMKHPHLREFFSLIELGGLYAGDNFLSWIKERLKQKGFSDEITFKDYVQKTNCDLSIIVSNTTLSEMLVLNHRTAPDCPVAHAVRMSMSIPFLWQEVIWQSDWGKYLDQDLTGNVLVDGGVISNFPIELLTSTSPEVIKIMGPVPCVPSIGLLLDEKLEVVGAEPLSDKGSSLDTPLKNSKPIKRVNRLINTMLSSHDNFSISAYEDLVCHLPVQGYGTTEFDMTDQRLESLINSARNAMTAYLDKLPKNISQSPV